MGTVGGVFTRQAVWYIAGTLTVAANQSQEIVYRGPAGTIKRADARVKTAPTGADLTFDININGTTIWSTQANRVKVVAAATSGTQTTFNTTALADGDILTVDIDVIGSTIAGVSATVLLEIEVTAETA
jgi:hypothetical protein